MILTVALGNLATVLTGLLEFKLEHSRHFFFEFELTNCLLLALLLDVQLLVVVLDNDNAPLALWIWYIGNSCLKIYLARHCNHQLASLNNHRYSKAFYLLFNLLVLLDILRDFHTYNDLVYDVERATRKLTIAGFLLLACGLHTLRQLRLQPPQRLIVLEEDINEFSNERSALMAWRCWQTFSILEACLHCLVGCLYFVSDIHHSKSLTSQLICSETLDIVALAGLSFFYLLEKLADCFLVETMASWTLREAQQGPLAESLETELEYNSQLEIELQAIIAN